MPPTEPSTPTREAVEPWTSTSGVRFLPWGSFIKSWGSKWQPGEHLSVIAPAGAGKSTLVTGLLGLRRYNLVLDPKGGDNTIANLHYPRLPDWPGEKRMSKLVSDNVANGRPSRYLVGPIVVTTADLTRLRAACAGALHDAFEMGGWTVYVDELQVLTDRRMMNLGGPAARLLVAARSKGVTFVSSFQAPSWVPQEAIRQPTWIAVSYTRDTDTVNRLAEIVGRPRAEFRGAVKALPPFHWIIVGRDPRSPLLVTKPPYVAPLERKV